MSCDLPSTHCQYNHTCKMGLQSRTEELRKVMPFRDTVAGEALSMLCTVALVRCDSQFG